MSGMGLIAAVLVAGPAQASGSAGQATAKSAASQADNGSKVRQHRDRDFVAGYFSSERACEREGRKGEFFGKWDDYDCDYVRFGFRRGMWQLEVERDWRGDWRGNGRGDGWDIGHRGNDHHGRGHKDSDRHPGGIRKNDDQGGKYRR